MRPTLATFLIGLCFVFSARADEPPSFVNDVLPLLTRYGCNSGGCHGKLAGQNGFRLSLRGYAPELDHEWITRESRSRRIDWAAPSLSLLLRKAVGEVPHGGGQRFERDGRAYQMLLEWLRNGAPGPRADEPAVTRLAIEPASAVLKPGQQRQLTVRATYTDGSERDVTWLARFDSGDPGLLDVSALGGVNAHRHGETIVRAAFADHIAVARFTLPLETPTQPDWYARRNNAIDEHVFNKLAALRIEPSPDCDDATFLRRAFLDTIGTLPTPDEARAFLADNQPDKRTRLVEHLLGRPEFVDYWALLLGDLLQNRKERDHDVRGPKGVQAFHQWLREQLAANRPWDAIARQVLTASGSAADQPAVGYFIVTVGEKDATQSEVTDSVAQAFLATRVGCARCHNHPLERFTQDDYYHFTAFFARVAMNRQAVDKGPTSLVVGTRHGANLVKQMADEQTKRSELAAKNADEKQLAEADKRIDSLRQQIDKERMQPVAVSQPRTGKPLPPRPLDRSEVVIEAGSDPRVVLANWMTDPRNELFAGAMVNRLWKHFLGVGLVEPVDDLRATNPPSNAELWNELVRDFTGSGFDSRQVMRRILNSRTYQLAADTRPTNVYDTRFYSHYYPRRLPAEVLLDAICQATGVPETFKDYPAGSRAIQIPDPQVESYFLTLFGRSPRTTACACERENDVTLPQLLHLHNGDLSQKVSAGQGRLATLLQRHSENGRVIEELFLATLSRMPTTAERESIGRSIAESPNRQEAFIDLFWALLNAKDFAFAR